MANYYAKTLKTSVHGTNRNVTMENWFTSVELADELVQDYYNLTIVGSLRKNKRVLQTKGRKASTSMF